jgi:hypothetical protein
MHFRREGRTVMAGVARRSMWAVYRIVLLGMAIQGLTPDSASLASPWLLRMITTASVDGLAAGDGSSSMPKPPRGSEEGGAAGAICQHGAAVSAPRVRLDDARRLSVPFLAASLRDRPMRSAPRLVRSRGLVQRWPDGLIPSLCRFLC